MNALGKHLLSALVLCGLGGGIYWLTILSPIGLDIRVKHWLGLLGYLACFGVFKNVICPTSLKKYMTVTTVVAFLHACCMLKPGMIIAWSGKDSIVFFVQWMLVIEGIAVISGGGFAFISILNSYKQKYRKGK